MDVLPKVQLAAIQNAFFFFSLLIYIHLFLIYLGRRVCLDDADSYFTVKQNCEIKSSTTESVSLPTRTVTQLYYVAGTF